MTRNIEYWMDFWQSLFPAVVRESFSSEADREYPKFNILNSRILLRELVDEIKTTSLRHSENRKFLFDHINLYFIYDPPTVSCLKDVFSLIRKEFDNPRLDILIRLCEKALSICDSFTYYDAAVDTLKDMLLSGSPVSTDDLRILCQDIIVELLEFGYSQSFIKDIPSSLFSHLNHNNELFHTQFPHDYALPETYPTKDELSLYNQNLKRFMDSLTDEHRLIALTKYPRTTKKDRIYLFQVRGLRGSGTFNVGPIKFYCPQTERLLTDPRFSNDGKNREFFGSPPDQVYFNTAVPIKTVDSGAGEILARKKLVDAINCIRLRYYSRSHYEISDDCLIINPKGQFRGLSSRLTHKYGLLHWSDSLLVDDGLLQSISGSPIFQKAALAFFDPNNKDLFLSRIKESLHWHRKAREAESQVDMVLWFWVSIENLLTSSPTFDQGGLLRKLKKGEKEYIITVAMDLLPRMRSISNIYRRGWAVFNEVNFQISHNRLNLPDDLMCRAGIRQSGYRHYLANFVRVIPEITQYVGDNLLHDHLTELDNFYSDSKKAAALIEKDREKFEYDVVMLYRIRNKIIHSAKVDDLLIPYYADSASLFSVDLINGVIDQYFQKNNHTIQSIIAALFAEYDLLLKNIESNGPGSAIFEMV